MLRKYALNFPLLSQKSHSSQLQWKTLYRNQFEKTKSPFESVPNVFFIPIVQQSYIFLRFLVLATLIIIAQHIDLTKWTFGDIWLCLCMLRPYLYVIEHQVEQFLTMMWFSQSRPSFTKDEWLGMFCQRCI